MVSQHLPWPGKARARRGRRQAEADAARSDFEASRRELALTASLLFDQYFVAVRSIEVNAHHVDLMRSMQAAATAQYEVGRASAQDPLQAEFELTHMEHDTVILASQRDVTVAQMNELLHRAPELPLPPPPKRSRIRALARRLERRPSRDGGRRAPSRHRRGARARAGRAGTSGAGVARVPARRHGFDLVLLALGRARAPVDGGARFQPARAGRAARRRRRRSQGDARAVRSRRGAHERRRAHHRSSSRSSSSKSRDTSFTSSRSAFCPLRASRSTRPARRSSRRRCRSSLRSTPRRTCAGSSSNRRGRKPTTTGGALSSIARSDASRT
jgi:hypothetical protein